LVVRKPRIGDVPKIYEILKEFAAKELMLPRSFSEIYDFIRDFFVLCPEAEPETIAGVCALHVCWSDLGEIRSLAVAPSYQGSNLGRALLEACFEESRHLGLKRIFVLTYIPEYFQRFGFQIIDKSELPQKIWADCLKCVKFPECGEIALERSI